MYTHTHTLICRDTMRIKVTEVGVSITDTFSIRSLITLSFKMQYLAKQKQTHRQREQICGC